MDAQSIDVALAHVQKLATRGVFTRFRDAISVLEAGFFGLWGEWHDVGAPASTSLVQSAENRARLVRALLAALPADLPVLLRRPRFRKELEGGAAPLSAAELARVGFHNDCFLASADDSGTYDGGVSPDTWKRYIADATARGVPLGGETCNDDPTFTTCAVAEQELARLHFSYLNNDYDKAVLDRFRREGCYDRIAARLGYRLVATKLERTARVVAGAAMRVRVHLENRGYAPPRRPYGLALALRGGGAEVPLAVTRQTGAEPAGWAAGETSVYEATVAVPRSAAAGRYALTLRIALSGAPGGAEDVVRLANEALFDGRTGAHVLFDDVDVVPGGS